MWWGRQRTRMRIYGWGRDLLHHPRHDKSTCLTHTQRPVGHGHVSHWWNWARRHEYWWAEQPDINKDWEIMRTHISIKKASYMAPSHMKACNSFVWQTDSLFTLWFLICTYSIDINIFKGMDYPKTNICWKCVHPQAIPEVGEFVPSSDLEKCRIASLTHQWMLCSEWVPSEWDSDKNITIIHTTPVHQFMFWEAKSWNKCIITMLLTSNHCFQLNYQSMIHDNLLLSLTSKSTYIFMFGL